MSLFARFEQKNRRTFEPGGAIQVNKSIQPARQASSAPPKDPFQNLKIDLHKKVIAELADLPQEKRDRRESVAERIGDLVGRLIDESGQHVSRSDRQRKGGGR
ncbi:hypothetical protein [Desulfofundulus thermosubterraneus]|uniref:Pilus assembly protein CpaF n=1 Tax=Desulfofundulus thermosubterraneus DSM 16057 TaxID=1121432 RepID=A0A1M6AEI1_9FIRM|nr:hypothetical protein [Desulfofundulus thermosubterraneus]SHI34875.1 pilus assembly protein CpaF [Desulfofundulus thermosubterraneus DSM 16057]